jgi:hypothetical protein
LVAWVSQSVSFWKRIRHLIGTWKCCWIDSRHFFQRPFDASEGFYKFMSIKKNSADCRKVREKDCRI